MNPYEQRRRALILANQVRCQRAGIKHNLRMIPDVAQSRRRAADLIEDPPQALEGMQVADLLRACRYIGSKRIGVFLDAARVDGSRLIGDLSEPERSALCAALRFGIALTGAERQRRYRMRTAA